MNRTASCYQTNSSVVFKNEISSHVTSISYFMGDGLQKYNFFSARQKHTKLEKKTLLDSLSPVSKSIIPNSIDLSIIICLEKTEVISRDLPVCMSHFGCWIIIRFANGPFHNKYFPLHYNAVQPEINLKITLKCIAMQMRDLATSSANTSPFCFDYWYIYCWNFKTIKISILNVNKAKKKAAWDR